MRAPSSPRRRRQRAPAARAHPWGVCVADKVGDHLDGAAQVLKLDKRLQGSASAVTAAGSGFRGLHCASARCKSSGCDGERATPVAGRPAQPSPPSAPPPHLVLGRAGARQLDAQHAAKRAAQLQHVRLRPVRREVAHVQHLRRGGSGSKRFRGAAAAERYLRARACPSGSAPSRVWPRSVAVHCCSSGGRHAHLGGRLIRPKVVPVLRHVVCASACTALRGLRCGGGARTARAVPAEGVRSALSPVLYSRDLRPLECLCDFSSSYFLLLACPLLG